jgi:hypothetical protein
VGARLRDAVYASEIEWRQVEPTHDTVLLA